MGKKINFELIVILFLLISFIYSCANKGPGPTGGPKDEEPPRVMKSTPVNGSLNFQKKEIQVDFDENISLEKLNENVVISPPQKKNPDIRSYGKRLVVKFEDDLRDSTTYTINFGNAIVDLNEKNPLSNYRFSFSTSTQIDTLAVFGTVINAEDLNPISGIIVGIYAETYDSVFLEKPFLRIGKTDENGNFSIDNIKEGTYKIFALGDNNRDYYFQPGEGVAFYDSLITPTFELHEMRDTIWAADSLTIDSIHIHSHNHLLPDDILLRYFKENKKRQYLVKAERLQPEKLTLYFNTTLTELPEIEPLNFDWENDQYIIQRNNTLDTLSYWLTDSLIWKIDTLEMAVKYLKTDSIYQLIPTTDTLSLAMRKSNVRTKAKKTTEAPKEPLPLKNNISSTLEIYNNIIIQLGEPLKEYDLEKIILSEKVDTIFNKLQYTWQKVDSSNMSYSISYKWEAGQSYQLDIDSAAFVSVYDKVNDKYAGNFKIRTLEEYSEIKILLTDYDPKAVIQILDNKDKVVATKKALSAETLFQHLKPAEYYVRLFIDENENGVWDTGDLSHKIQPEEVYYYPYKLTLKANFEFTETWDHKELPLLEQKPIEIQQDPSKKK